MAFEDPQARRQMEGWNEAWARDGKCRVMFHKQLVLDERRTSGYTEEKEILNDDGSVRIEKKRFPGEGRPIYKEVDFVKKFTPGDPTNIVDREVWPIDREEYPNEWAAYLAGKDQGVSGTPLEMLPGITAARIEEFKHFPGAPIRTIEDLAGLADVHAQKFLGFNEDRQRARDWLSMAQRAAPVTEMRQELAERDARIKSQAEQMQELQKQVSEMKAMLDSATRPEAPKTSNARRG
jgi:hypothetical protein